MAAERRASAGEGSDDERVVDERVVDERVIDEEVTTVVVHSSPRYGRFLAIGVILGLLVAAILTFASGVDADPGGPLSTASGVLRVFGVSAAVCVGAGLVLMGSLAIVLDRRSSKRARAARAAHATTLVMDLDAPANDDIPAWVRDEDDLR